MYCNGIQSYRKTNVITSDPGRLIIMCYEGAIDSLKLAKEKAQKKDYEKKAKAIIKAQEIIDELLCSLDLEKGGAIAINLSSLYNYMLRRILYGDVNKDIGALDEVIGMLNELLSAWQEVASKPESQVQSTQDSLYQEKRAVGSGYISA
jgi:flagellar secretion chaperone FliS